MQGYFVIDCSSSLFKNTQEIRMDVVHSSYLSLYINKKNYFLMLK